jgi:sorting nexin-3/12
MERMPEPQPPPAANPLAKPPPTQQNQDPNQQSQSKQWQMPTGFASTGSQAHTQSFEEIYGVPENFLEIEVYPLQEDESSNNISRSQC